MGLHQFVVEAEIAPIHLIPRQVSPADLATLHQRQRKVQKLKKIPVEQRDVGIGIQRHNALRHVVKGDAQRLGFLGHQFARLQKLRMLVLALGDVGERPMPQHRPIGLALRQGIAKHP